MSGHNLRHLQTQSLETFHSQTQTFKAATELDKLPYAHTHTHTHTLAVNSQTNQTAVVG